MTPRAKTFTKPTKKMVKYKFNDVDLLGIGKDLAERSCELQALEHDKKRVTSDFAARIAAKESDISIASNKIQSGYEYRDMECTTMYNHPKVGRKTTRRDDTMELVAEEDMTSDELQMEFPVEA